MKVRGRCHCRHCQMLSGTAFRAGIPAPAEGFRILAGKPRRYVKVADSGARRVHALSFSEKFLGSFARSLHRRLQRVAPSERIESRVNAPEPDETLRVAEVVVEDREVAPRRVVRDVPGRGIEARRRASGRKLARQVADLFRRVVIFKGHVSGRREAKSRAVALSSSVPSISLPSTVRRSFVMRTPRGSTWRAVRIAPPEERSQPRLRAALHSCQTWPGSRSCRRAGRRASRPA